MRMSCDSGAVEPIPEGGALPISDEGAPGWKRTLYVMWAAQMVAILGFMFVVPFMPFYIRELGVTDERLVPLWAGGLGSATGLTFAVAAPLWGMLADRYGRRRMVLRAMLAGAVVLVAMAFVTNVHQLLALRIAQGALTGTVSASLAMVSSMTPRRRLGFSLGLMQTAVLAGASLGPWLGGIAADALGYRLPFVAAGGMCLVSALLVLFLTRESFTPPPRREGRQPSTPQLLRQTPGFATMLGIYFLVALAGTIVAPIFPLFVERLARDPAHVGSLTGMLIGVTGLAEAIAAITIGRLSDRKGQKKILVICTLATGLLCVPQAIATSVGQLLGLRAALGLAGGGTAPTINALVGRLMPRRSYGRAYGLTSAVSGLGGSIGPLIGGALAASLGLQWPFVVMGVMLVGISVVARFRVVEPGAEARSPAPTAEAETGGEELELAQVGK